jgi:hypothetical protein
MFKLSYEQTAKHIGMHPQGKQQQASVDGYPLGAPHGQIEQAFLQWRFEGVGG